MRASTFCVCRLLAGAHEHSAFEFFFLRRFCCCLFQQNENKIMKPCGRANLSAASGGKPKTRSVTMWWLRLGHTCITCSNSSHSVLFSHQGAKAKLMADELVDCARVHKYTDSQKIGQPADEQARDHGNPHMFNFSFQFLRCSAFVFFFSSNIISFIFIAHWMGKSACAWCMYEVRAVADPNGIAPVVSRSGEKISKPLKWIQKLLRVYCCCTSPVL